MASTKVWQDSWVSLSQRVIPYGPITEDMSDLRVSDLLTTDLRWNVDRVEAVLPELASLVLSLKPSFSGAEDRYVWYPTRNGIYTSKTSYHSLRGNKAPTLATGPATNSGAYDWIKDVWKGQFSPKLKTFLWSVIQKAIPLGINLQSRGVNQEAKCIRCGEIESETHIFFRCEFAKKVWENIGISPAVDFAALSGVSSALVSFRQVRCIPPTGVPTTILPWVL